MNRLYFVRHGENPANLTREFSYKRVDYSLTPKGVLQAQQTAEYFADKDIHEVYCSPLKRAVETAEIIAARLGLQVVEMENWREVNVGDLEGMPPTDENWETFYRVTQAWFAGRREVAFPGGEDYDTLWARTREGIELATAGKSGRNIVIVGHGGIFTYTLKELCPSVDMDQIFSARTNNCSVSEVLVELREGKLHGKLVAWAQDGHMHGEAAQFAW